MDDKYIDLMTRGVDGDLSDAEKLELEHLLERDGQAKLLYDNMLNVSNRLTGIPHVPAPDDLKESIQRRIRNSALSRPEKTGGFDRLADLLRPFLRPRPALIFAAGTVCGIFLLALVWLSQDGGRIDPSQISGTIMTPVAADVSRWPIDRAISNGDLKGTIKLKRENSLVEMAIDIKSLSLTSITIDFNSAELGFHGMTFSADPADSLTQIPGRITAWHRGTMAGTVYFLDLSQSVAEINIAFKTEQGMYQESVSIPTAGN